MSEVLHATDQTFDTEVMQAEQPVLVDFSATWCGPCKKLEPIVHEIAGDYDGRLKVVKVDVDQAPSIAQKFGVLSVPTLLLFKEGAVKDQVVGLVSKQALSDRVDKVI
ncbi:MAG: thioredoxin [Acidobacteria bacterium]|nr:thioredoxin [Acidobacteriota bacterium]NIM63569.1 thioredoxin [Acidobacteriota bacterium]NIO58431.1 thioredoxin [Acidobacteriota bacterium]NIQ29486.1 thioredoxin [Acidobacteriota bacterium]NIQ84163.1 thioredoxin [Acidobacteriota bacterium]